MAAGWEFLTNSLWSPCGRFAESSSLGCGVVWCPQVSAELGAMLDALGVDDKPPDRPLPVPKKKKAPVAVTPRKPYRTYTSVEGTSPIGAYHFLGEVAGHPSHLFAFVSFWTHRSGISIYVGKSAVDNDVLSTDKSIRDDDDWWMHAADSAGSHVVVKSVCTPSSTDHHTRPLHTHNLQIEHAQLNNVSNNGLKNVLNKVCVCMCVCVGRVAVSEPLRVPRRPSPPTHRPPL
jgi:hypothetical protein